jgi:tRNA-specific 2-thiouridylase
MLKHAKEKLNADKIATGHYAKIEIKDDKYYLATAKDQTKDQTYFLSYTNKEVLKDVIFPLGDLLKTEVREIAKKLKLPNATKKDSTGICFIGERNFSQFLQNYIEVKKGDILDIETNKVIGTHDGISFYTIGQRKGLDLGGQESAKYVCKKDYDKNIIYVANVDDDKYL